MKKAEARLVGIQDGAGGKEGTRRKEDGAVGEEGGGTKG